jgi:hypothetical protein
MDVVDDARRGANQPKAWTKIIELGCNARGMKGWQRD